MDLELIVGIVVVALGATIAVLKLVAPKTKTDKDDKALDILEKIEDVVAPDEDK